MMVKLPQPCPKCEAPIMNYSGWCGACGYKPEAPIAHTSDTAAEAAARIATLEARCKELEEALKPFAEFAGKIPAQWVGEVPLIGRPPLSTFRRAAHVLATEKIDE